MQQKIHSLYIVEDADKSFYDGFEYLIMESKKNDQVYTFEINHQESKKLNQLCDPQTDHWIGRYKNTTVFVSDNSTDNLFNLISKSPECLFSMIVLKHTSETNGKGLFVHSSNKGLALIVFENDRKRLRVRFMGDSDLTEHLIAGDMNNIEKSIYDGSEDNLEIGQAILQHHLSQLISQDTFDNDFFDIEMNKLETTFA
jgi:hypothetical protein